MEKSTKTTQGKPANESVPIFLRKTYHMIDTCDKTVACWSDDGETFIVKNTDVFEKKIIPQFFKHSKFSSFVRQLNFYGFRKIKYADTIKIDAKLEAETANFWRFRHEKFVRGKPELLIDIKRSNGHQTTTTKPSVVQPVVVKSEEAASLKTEVTTLKKRIEAMTKNIDDLTSMVQKVSLKQKDEEPEVGTKRKKIVSDDQVRPDASPSSMELDDLASEVASFPPLPPPLVGVSRENSDASKLTDDDFVDHLFTAFGEEDNMEGLLDEIPPPPPTPLPAEDENAPDPQLMKKLSDALKLLPKEMQEMIVDRLVANIVGTDSMERNVKAASALTDVTKPNKVMVGGKVAPNQVPPSPALDARPAPAQMLPMPLAAATLAALLSQYSEAVNKNKATKTVMQQEKSLPPVIPIHA